MANDSLLGGYKGPDSLPQGVIYVLEFSMDQTKTTWVSLGRSDLGVFIVFKQNKRTTQEMSNINSQSYN